MEGRKKSESMIALAAPKLIKRFYSYVPYAGFSPALEESWASYHIQRAVAALAKAFIRQCYFKSPPGL